MIKKALLTSVCFTLIPILAYSHDYHDNQYKQFLPNPILTPGDVLTTDPKVICVSGYSRTVRKVSKSTKDKVYKSYDITYKFGHYKIDHLISLQLGGSNDIKNLWPTGFNWHPYNAKKKDRLENKLRWLICHRLLDIKTAQRAIATDWISAYEKYVTRDESDYVIIQQ